VATDLNTTDGFELIEEFVVESLESLRAVPRLLHSYRRNPEDPESIHAAFRAIHSIKGCAACLGLEVYKGFAHSLEHTLADIRDGKQPLGDDLQYVLIEGFDYLDVMLNRALDGEIVTEMDPEQETLLQRIGEVAAKTVNGVEPSGEDLLLKETRRLAEEISRCGVPPVADLSRRLKLLVDDCLGGGPDRQDRQPATPPAPNPAEFRHVSCSCGEHDVTDRVALLLRPFLALQGGEYTHEVGEGFLAAAADFAAWAKHHGHDHLAAALERAAADFRTIFQSPLEIDENLLSIVWDHLWPQLETLKAPASGPGKSTPKKAEQEQEPAAKPAGTPARTKPKSRFVRVKEERLDEFLEHVSNLFVSGELLKDLQSRMAQTSQLRSLVEELRQIHRDMKMQFTTLQQGVMALRRVSVSGLFSTFPRMARTLASQLGKRIDVHVSGEDTEIDKVLAEDLDAPLTHLVRNVVDHGIETPDQRRARGVDESGNLWLKAEQTRHHVRITVADDGRGIDLDRLRDKAVEKGIYTRSKADALTEKETLDLIFHPGLGTHHVLWVAVCGLFVFAVVAFFGAIYLDACCFAHDFWMGLLRSLRAHRQQYAGFVIHMGFFCLALGVTASSLGSRRHEVTMQEGETLNWAGQRVRLVRIGQRQLPDKLVAEAFLELQDSSDQPHTLAPAQHFHLLQNEWTTEVSIYSTWGRDYYAILHGGESEGQVRLTLVENPMMRFIWLGGYIMGFGAIVAIWPARRSPSTKPVNDIEQSKVKRRPLRELAQKVCSVFLLATTISLVDVGQFTDIETMTNRPALIVAPRSVH